MLTSMQARQHYALAVYAVSCILDLDIAIVKISHDH